MASLALASGASAEKLLAASEAQSYADALSSLRPNRGPDFIRLEPGSPIPHILGDTGDDLVFTPVTPCRIIDTRIATGGSAGLIGPDTGKQFSVSLADFTPQGGAASNCGIPFAPAAVSVNIVSTAQTGVGNVRAIQSGGGIPNAAFLNYTPSITIANAGVVRTAGSTGSSNLFIYSGNSQTHVVVDIMGYFAAPVATLVDNNVVQAATAVAASATFDAFSPACPAGYRLTGGGFLTSGYAGAQFAGGRPVQGASTGIISGANVADRWLCRGTTRRPCSTWRWATARWRASARRPRP